MGISAFLMDAQTLSGRLGQPDLRLVDCRFNLLQPRQGRIDYLQSHIPGAVYADLEQNLAAAIGTETGRHPLPDAMMLAKQLGEWGVGNDTQVLVYDQQSGAIAARLWWLLRWLGHEKVSLLDGGFAAWANGSRALEQGEVHHSACDYVARPNANMVVTTPEVVSLMQLQSQSVLVDARSAERFDGLSEPLDSVAGHIPGAVNFPMSNSLDTEGRWLSQAVLREMWHSILPEDPSADWTAMCGSGVTACHLAFSAEYAGCRRPKIYVGSWSEWIRDPERPVASKQE